MSPALRRSRPFTYRDATALLDGEQSAFVDKLNRVGGAVSGAAQVATLGALDLFALRDEVVRWGGQIVGSLGERLTGINRIGRTDRIAAAHAIIAITAFYEALDSSDAPLKLADLELSREEQAALATGGTLADSYGELVAFLADYRPPMPAPQRPYEDARREMREYYATAMSVLRRFVVGLRVWEELEQAQRDAFDGETQDLPERALHAYDDAFRWLAADVPEFALWAGQVDSQATRETVERVGGGVHDRLAEMETGLAGVTELLAGMSSGARADERRAQLAARYRQALDKPVVPVSGPVEGVRFPTLGSGYVNPCCRVAETDHQARPVEESWWASQTRLDDVQAFLVGHLTAQQAIRAPLMLLGQPGSGKSVLTRVLAARLPENDFLPVRVPLRAVPADCAIQEQIEHAVFEETGERVAWADLARAAGEAGALPVVLLDGFDELLQATQVNRSDYLARVAEFQERESDLGRSVAVLVTSRTAVADRARYPEEAVVARLEPFTEGQVRTWLEVWNDTNREEFQRRGITPLSAEDVLAHGELAEQPLLLLMLALYDAEANALRNSGSELNRAELYERILRDFARREVRKRQPDLPADSEDRAVQSEMEQLALAALAMFVRGQQSITETALDRDLEKLGSGPATTSAGDDFHRALTAAQLLVGRFFFVHESQALRDTQRERSFEFLHATFGEFLVAWRVVRELDRMARTREVLAGQGLAKPQDDHRFLFDMLSFAPITSREVVPEFAEQLLLGMGEKNREKCFALLTELLGSSLDQVPDRAGYSPVPERVTARLAAYSANLVLLAVFAAGGRQIAEDELLRYTGTWGDFVHLWRSQFTKMASRRMMEAIRVRHHAEMTTTFQREDGSPVSYRESGEFLNQFEVATGPGKAFEDFVVPASSVAESDFRDLSCLSHGSGLAFMMAFAPIYKHFGGATLLAQYGEEGIISPTHLLLDLALTRADSENAEHRADRYIWCFGKFLDLRVDLTALCTQLAKDAYILPPETVARVLGEILLVNFQRHGAIYRGFIEGVLGVLDALSERVGHEGASGLVARVLGVDAVVKVDLWRAAVEQGHPAASALQSELLEDSGTAKALAERDPDRFAEVRRLLEERGEHYPFADLEAE